MAEGNFGYGQLDPWDLNSEFSAISFIVQQMMVRMSTMKLVRVEAVHLGQGDPPAPATVDVLPLVNQIDGNNNATPHGTVYGIPCFRLQGGAFSVVIDPVVGDVGFVVCADRDISSVKANGGSKASNPGSFRKFDLADGVYVGGCLNAAPTSYIRVKSDGNLKIVTPGGNVLETSSLGFAITGNLTVTGEVTRGFGTGDQVTLGHHLHTSGGTGSPTSVPTPGT